MTTEDIIRSAGEKWSTTYVPQRELENLQEDYILPDILPTTTLQEPGLKGLLKLVVKGATRSILSVTG